MCDKCENIDLEQQEFAEEQENQEEQLVDLSSDERFIELEIEKELMRIDKEIILDTSNVTEDKEFIKGVQEGLLLAGFYNALVSCGISSKTAEDMTVNKQTCDHNTRLQEMNNRTSIEISKNQAIQVQNQQL